MADTETPQLITQTTILSLLSTVAILLLGYLTSRALLPPTAPPKTRFLFIWHATDALIHFLLEGSYLSNCFFSSLPISPTSPQTSPFLPPNTHFLNDPSRLYGAAYASSPTSALWMEYAKADKRWGGSDLTIISLELLTVFVAGPIAVWVCYCLKAKRSDAWFWMVVLATGELYGGWMTFAPEWLSGSQNLDTSRWMYGWVYLGFFNSIWVWVPLWVLWQAYGEVSGGGAVRQGGRVVDKGK